MNVILKIIAILGVIILFGIIFALPLYLIVNLVCLAFHLSFRITLLQAFAVSMLLTVIKNLLFKEEK